MLPEDNDIEDMSIEEEVMSKEENANSNRAKFHEMV
jgi:hypothetical protein